MDKIISRHTLAVRTPIHCCSRPNPVSLPVSLRGIECHRGGVPGVYADVVKLLPWIRNALTTLSQGDIYEQVPY